MARPRKFDEVEVLNAAMAAFWRNGYSATTMRGLESETGVGIRSLANAFGDKDELFVASLRIYREMAQGAIAMMFDPPSVEAIIAFFGGTGAPAEPDSPLQSGCLMVNTVFELDQPPSSVSEEIAAYREMWRSTFEQSLVNDGIPDAGQRAEFLLASLWGALSQIRLAGDTTAAAPMANVVVDVVRSWKVNDN